MTEIIVPVVLIRSNAARRFTKRPLHLLLQKMRLTGQKASERYMQSEEFGDLARLRNGVETVPSNLRKNYHLDNLPRGKQRGNFSLEVK